MHPTRTLPDDYRAAWTLELARDRRAMLLLNGLGIPLTILALLGFGWAILRLRPDLGSMGLTIEGFRGLAIVIVALVLTIALTLILHELVHGLFFWLFTRARPHFGFRGAYAFAAAPDWYLPRNPFLVVGLAPLILISIAGLLLIPLMPVGWLPLLLIALVMNAGGAIGDLYVTWLLLRMPPTTMVRDLGDAMTFYHRG